MYLNGNLHIYTTLTAFEISSTGNVTKENKQRLSSLHKFCKPGTKLSTFVKNICKENFKSQYILIIPYLVMHKQPSLHTPPTQVGTYQPLSSPALGGTRLQPPSLETWPAASPVPGPGWFAMDYPLSIRNKHEQCVCFLQWISRQGNLTLIEEGTVSKQSVSIYLLEKG